MCATVVCVEEIPTTLPEEFHLPILRQNEIFSPLIGWEIREWSHQSQPAGNEERGGHNKRWVWIMSKKFPSPPISKRRTKGGSGTTWSVCKSSHSSSSGWKNGQRHQSNHSWYQLQQGCSKGALSVVQLHAQDWTTNKTLWCRMWSGILSSLY